MSKNDVVESQGCVKVLINPCKSLRYIATIGGECVALIGWNLPVLKCSVRDRFIGWDDETKLKRLHLIVNNVRFLILPWIRISNLASKVLSHNLKRLSSDFQKVYGHPGYLAETFVDIARYKGYLLQSSKLALCRSNQRLFKEWG